MHELPRDFVCTENDGLRSGIDDMPEDVRRLPHEARSFYTGGGTGGFPGFPDTVPLLYCRTVGRPAVARAPVSGSTETSKNAREALNVFTELSPV